MSERKYRIVGGVRIGPNQKLYYKTSAIGAWNAISLNTSGSPLVYYPTGNNESFDLIKLIKDKLVAAGLTTAQFEIELDSSVAGWGRITFGPGLASYLALSSRANGISSVVDNSDNVWAILFPGINDGSGAQVYLKAVSGVGVTYVHDRPHGFGLYPRRYLIQDTTPLRHRAAQTVMLGGRATTVYAAQHRTRELGIRIVGSVPRTLTQNEYHQLSDLLAYAATGLPMLIYPDNDVLTPYARHSNPYGWWRGIVLRDSGDWEPARADGDNYENWHKTIELMDIGEP